MPADISIGVSNGAQAVTYLRRQLVRDMLNTHCSTRHHLCHSCVDSGGCRAYGHEFCETNLTHHVHRTLCRHCGRSSWRSRPCCCSRISMRYERTTHFLLLMECLQLPGQRQKLAVHTEPL